MYTIVAVAAIVVISILVGYGDHVLFVGSERNALHEWLFIPIAIDFEKRTFAVEDGNNDGNARSFAFVFRVALVPNSRTMLRSL